MRLSRAAVILALAAATAAAGCGSSGGSSSGDASNAAKSYISALAKGDGAAACSHMTSALQSQIVTAAKQSNAGVSTCAAAVGKATTAVGASSKLGGKKVSISKVVIKGGSATVSASVAGAAPQPLKLQKVGGKWLVSGM